MFTALLDRVQEALDEVDGVDDETREQARRLLDKPRAASGTPARLGRRRRTARGSAHEGPWS